jgi:hypothetical protein
MPIPAISAFFQQATAHGSRSTVIRPLGWLTSICIAGFLTSVESKAPTWILVLLSTFAGLSVILYMASYVYCLITDKEALRSEKYQIQRLAIEKGFVGDSQTGVFNMEHSPTGTRLLSPSSQSSGQVASGDQS